MIINRYVPSTAVLRALSQARPAPCTNARRAYARTRTSADSSPVGQERIFSQRLKVLKKNLRAARENVAEDKEVPEVPLSERLINDPHMPTLELYERRPGEQGLGRLTQRIATPQDRRRQSEMHQMLDEDEANPAYDDAQLNRRLLDDMLADPDFTDLSDELKAMRDDIMTKEEMDMLQKEVKEDHEPVRQSLQASLQLFQHEVLQELVEDPELADVREDLTRLQDEMIGHRDMNKPEVQRAFAKVQDKLAAHPAFTQRLQALQGDEEDPGAELLEIDQDLKEMDGSASETFENPDEGLEEALERIEKLVKSLGNQPELRKSMDAALGADFLSGLADDAADAEESESSEHDEDRDPREVAKSSVLMEQLSRLQSVVQQQEGQMQESIQASAHAVPDPVTLDASMVTSLKQQILLAQQDPEHVAALQRLRVSLRPPLHIAPALKTFNQAIELAYLGANEDIRRILWRTYVKARTLPTFLQNLSDDAWDLLYYSQAVNWSRNENRELHLSQMLSDMKSVGRDGPPTKMST